MISPGDWNQISKMEFLFHCFFYRKFRRLAPLLILRLASEAVNPESSGSKDALVRVAVDKLKETKKSDDEPKNMAC
jgi:hypothetical protein